LAQDTSARAAQVTIEMRVMRVFICFLHVDKSF